MFCVRHNAYVNFPIFSSLYGMEKKKGEKLTLYADKPGGLERLRCSTARLSGLWLGAGASVITQ